MATVSGQERPKDKRFLFAKKYCVTHGQDLADRPADKSAHSERLPTLFCEKAKRSAQKYHFGAETFVTAGKRELELQEDDRDA